MTKHNEILRHLVVQAQGDSNVLGYLLFGSVATGTQREDSDIDIITILQANSPPWGLDNTMNDGIKVGNIFFTYDILVDSIKTVPYLLHPLGEAKLLFDRDDMIESQLEKIRGYFNDHPEIVDEWNVYYQQLREEKAQFGYEKTTIIDVWNDLEKLHSGGKTRRRFFNSFYLTNPRIFSVLKKFL
jgi:predicted nucleotidyltransferase